MCSFSFFFAASASTSLRAFAPCRDGASYVGISAGVASTSGVEGVEGELGVGVGFVFVPPLPPPLGPSKISRYVDTFQFFFPVSSHLIFATSV